MSLTNCKECGNIMVENPSGLCPGCLRDEEEAEDIVAKFLREAERASVEEISQATGVKEKTVLRMIKRGRITTEVPISYPCDTCGAPILEGRICSECANNITKQLKPEEWQTKTKQESKKREERMYINDMLRRPK